MRSRDAFCAGSFLKRDGLNIGNTFEWNVSYRGNVAFIKDGKIGPPSPAKS